MNARGVPFASALRAAPKRERFAVLPPAVALRGCSTPRSKNARRDVGSSLRNSPSRRGVDRHERDGLSFSTIPRPVTVLQLLEPRDRVPNGSPRVHVVGDWKCAPAATRPRKTRPEVLADNRLFGAVVGIAFEQTLVATSRPEARRNREMERACEIPCRTDHGERRAPDVVARVAHVFRAVPARRGSVTRIASFRMPVASRQRHARAPTPARSRPRAAAL